MLLKSFHLFQIEMWSELTKDEKEEKTRSDELRVIGAPCRPNGLSHSISNCSEKVLNIDGNFGPTHELGGCYPPIM